MKKNKLLTIMLIILATITLIGVLAWVLITQLTGKEEETEQTPDEMVSASVDVPELTTNLADDHMIKIQLKIVTDSEDAATELMKRDFQTNNIIIEQLSDMKKEDLKGSEGKALLKSVIKSKVNELMQEGEIKEVYITSCIIQ